RLLDFDELDGFAAWTFDHHRARVAEAIRLLKEFHALASEFRDPSIEVADAEGHMIHQMSTRADERRVGLAHVPIHRHVAEEDAGRGCAEHALLFQRRP